MLAANKEDGEQRSGPYSLVPQDFAAKMRKTADENLCLAAVTNKQTSAAMAKRLRPRAAAQNLHTAPTYPSRSKTRAAIPAGEYRDVLMAPTLIGLFQSGKLPVS